VAALVLAVAAVAPAFAQGAGGAIVGTTLDAQGGALPGVSVTVRNADTGVNRTAVTDGEGRYRIAGLPPGRYSLTTDLDGFVKADVGNLSLTIGSELRQDLTLGVSALAEAVSVTAEVPAVETTRSEIATVITQEQIETLPVEGRSAITLSLLLPGTSTDNTRAQRPGANVGAGGITTAGTNYIVDGLNNMISRAGDAREDLPQSAVQEFRVHTSQMPAEYGGRSGGVVNVVTRSGTNVFHGEAFEQFRHKSLSRSDRFEQARRDAVGAA
jgi:hypothetical protein